MGEAGIDVGRLLMRYHGMVQFSRYLLCILLLGCGSKSGQSGPIYASGGLLVDMEGNREVSLSRLRSAVATGDMSSPEAIAKSVTKLYSDSGFVQVKVKSTEDANHILVQIEEGPRFAFGSLRFRGIERNPLPKPPFKSGEVFSSNKLQAYMQSSEAYLAERKIEATIRPLTEMDLKQKRVHVTFEVQSSDAAFRMELRASACSPTQGIGNGEPLVLRHDQVVTLGPERTYHFSRICVRDTAAIRVCSSAEIRLGTRGSVVIGGRGVGSSDTRAANFTIRSLTQATLHVLFDTKAAPMRAQFFTPGASPLEYVVSGSAGLSLGAAQMQKGSVSARRSDTRGFPICH